jgi:hypothetical protein
MKAVLLSALTFISFSAFATNLVAEFPKVQFGSVFVQVDEVCVDGDVVNTQHAVAVCTEWKGNESSPCSKEEKKILSTPVEYRKAIPVGETGWETVTMTIPLNYNIPYGYYTEGGLQVVTTKHFSIPTCE